MSQSFLCEPVPEVGTPIREAEPSADRFAARFNRIRLVPKCRPVGQSMLLQPLEAVAQLDSELIRHDIENRLTRLYSAVAEWTEEDGTRPSAETLDRASQGARRLPIAVLLPTPRGGIAAEWSGEGWTAMVVFRADGTTRFSGRSKEIRVSEMVDPTSEDFGGSVVEHLKRFIAS